MTEGAGLRQFVNTGSLPQSGGADLGKIFGTIGLGVTGARRYCRRVSLFLCECRFTTGGIRFLSARTGLCGIRLGFAATGFF